MRLGLGVGAERRRGGAALAAVAAAALRARRTARRAQLAAWLRQRARDRAGAASGARGLARATRTGAALCSAAAGLFSVVFDARYRRGAGRCASSTRCGCSGIGYSWAGPVSLVVPYDLARDARRAAAGRGTLVRFSIGLEAVDDLIADLRAGAGSAVGG